MASIYLNTGNNFIRSVLPLICPLDRVVGTSKFQTAKPDAFFVVFLGMKAYDFVKKDLS